MHQQVVILSNNQLREIVQSRIISVLFKGNPGCMLLNNANRERKQRQANKRRAENNAAFYTQRN
jgi:hypothetical protein